MEFTVKKSFKATAHTLYHAWLDSTQHGAMTGGEADIEPREGASFTAWDGYIQGKNMILIPDQKIVQSWRTTEFPSTQADSLVEITFKKTTSGTTLILHHSQLTEDDAHYIQGWKDFYFKPMSDYFKK